MVPADVLGQGPVECRRLRPRQGTISRSSGRAVDQHQRRDAVGDDVRTFDSETERHRATHRVAHHDGAAEIEHAEHGGEIVDQPVEAERRRHRRRAAETPLVDGDHPPATRHQPRRQRSEDPEVGAVTVEQHHRPSGAALLGVQVAAVGRGDGMGALGREGEAIVGVGIRRGIEPGEDTMLVDHDAGDKRTDEPSGHQVSPATHVAAVRSSMIRGADAQTLARISRRDERRDRNCLSERLGQVRVGRGPRDRESRLRATVLSRTICHRPLRRDDREVRRGSGRARRATVCSDAGVARGVDAVEPGAAEQPEQLRLGEGDGEVGAPVAGSTSWMSTPLVSSVR